MGYILRIGFRHLEAIRSQTITVSMGLNWSKRRFDFREWLAEQAPELIDSYESVNGLDAFPSSFEHDRSWHYAILLNTVLMAHESRSTDDGVRYQFAHSMVSTSQSDHAEEDHAGADRGGSWDADPFPFRAGIIMTLGALEDFERGAIRILTGLQHAGSSYIDSLEPFTPRLSDFEATNPIYDELDRKRKTFTSGGRLRILKRFGIKESKDSWRTRLDNSWRDRNQIAHGLYPVNVTLSMFLQTHYDVLSAMRWLSGECCAVQNVVL